MAQVLDTKIYRHAIHPATQRTRTAPLKTANRLEDVQEAVVQQIFGLRSITHIALTQGHKMPCKAIVKLLLSLTIARFQTIDQF